MTQQKRHARLPVLSALCAFAVAAFAAAAGGDDLTAAASTRADITKAAVVRADGNNTASGFTLADYHQWRDDIGGIGGNIGGDIAAPRTTGDAIDNTGAIDNIRARAKASSGFGFDPMANLRGFAADAINSGSIADSRRRAQAALFASLEDALSRHGEEALLLNFTTLKRSRIDIQTELGGRKGQLGAALVGIINEQPASALGWQLRVYGGQESSKGFNVGLFYRRINDDMLLGANIFTDYENHRHGTFVRYSIGGEFQHRFVSFGANYYVPTTGEKVINEDEAAFSRKGYDLRARLVIPQTRYVRAAMDYYNYDGRRTEKGESGLRYGAEAYHFPVTGLRFGLFYDTDKEQVGSEFAYTKTFGEQQRIPADTEVPPLDLFAPVEREHSQRIVVLPRAVPVPIVFGGVAYHSSVFLTTFDGVVGTLDLSGSSTGYNYAVPAGSGLRVDSGGVIHANSNTTADITATIIIARPPRTSPTVTAIVSVKFIAQCGYAVGCAEFGHNANAVPSLTAATLMHRAGVRGAVDNQAANPVNVIAHVLAIDGSDAPRPFYQFIIDMMPGATGAINDVPTTGVNTGQTPLDVANELATQQVMWLTDREARCGQTCRTGQTNLTGGICVRGTGVGSNPAVGGGADCTIPNP